jgi:hypothetical protein
MSLLDGAAGRKDGDKMADGELLGGLRGSFMQASGDVKDAPPDLRKRLLVLALVVVVEAIVIGGAYGALSYTISQRVEEKSTIEHAVAEETKKTVAKAAEIKKAAMFNAQTVAAEAALEGHLRWTDFFAFLEERTKPTVKYVNFSGDADTGMVTLDAVGTTFRDVAEQIVIFREDPLVADVRATTASADIDDAGIAFSMGLKLKKELWTGAYVSARSATAVQAAVVSLACGASTDTSDAAARCFSAKVAACAPATVAAKNTLGSGEYLVVGPSDKGCRVSFTYTETGSLTEFKGKSYECAYDAKSDFWSLAGKSLDGCTGSLIDAFTPAQPVSS